MADDKPKGVGGTLAGWVKAILTSIVGLISGAVIMYLTPVVNNAVKPAKPIANFAAQANGLTVNFNNRSTGGIQGWWDFGDGTALEPFDPKAENVSHVYAKPGSYSVKLTLANLLGEENDRTASITIDGSAGNSPAAGPTIDQFTLVPEDPRERAPAVYKLTSKVKNASLCILGRDDKPTELLDGGGHERYIYFPESGAYTVRLAAVGGKQLVEQTKTVYVGANEGGEPMARLFVTYEAVRVRRVAAEWRIHCGWQGDTNQAVSTFRKERIADAGTIVSAKLINGDDKTGLVRNLKAELSPDKRKLVVTGELVRPTGALAPKMTAPHWVARFDVVTEERSAPQMINRGDVAMNVGLNKTVKIPMQPLEDGYEIVRKQVSLQLWDGAKKIWEGSKGVSNAKVTLNNQTCYVTATPQNDGVLLKIDSPSIGPIRPASFQLLPKRK